MICNLTPKMTVRKLTDAISPVLLIGGGRNGVAIVTTEKYQRTFKGSRKVEAGVCVSFAGCSLSEVTDDGTVQVFSLDGICSSGRWNRHTGHADTFTYALHCTVPSAVPADVNTQV